jgi:hypothetical protein
MTCLRATGQGLEPGYTDALPTAEARLTGIGNAVSRPVAFSLALRIANYDRYSAAAFRVCDDSACGLVEAVVRAACSETVPADEAVPYRESWPFLREPATFGDEQTRAAAAAADQGFRPAECCTNASYTFNGRRTDEITGTERWPVHGGCDSVHGMYALSALACFGGNFSHTFPPNIMC